MSDADYWKTGMKKVLKRCMGQVATRTLACGH